MADTMEFRVVEGWEQLPEGYTHLDVVGVDVDSQDRVFVFTRQQSRVIVYNRDGSFVRSWGEDFFTPRTHGLTIAPDDSVWVVEEGHECCYRFSPTGELLQTIGTKGVASDTGYDGRNIGSIVRGGPPFNRPTNLAVAPNGDLYVSDGYGNARVHHFSPDGTLVNSWGEPGTGPGQFNLVHGISVTDDGRVAVADRENDRIQFFTLGGEYITAWDVQRPTNVRVGPDGNFYISELWHRKGEETFRSGLMTDDQVGRVSVLDNDGNILARFGGPDRAAAGNFAAPHDICVDSHGDIYVGEVTWTFAFRPGYVPEDCHTFQKFARVR